MNRQGLKIGDRVRVIRIEVILPWENGPKLIGQIGVVSNIVNGRFTIAVEFGAEKLEAILGDAYSGNTHYYFTISEIEHAVKVGEQLMFEFMKG